MLKIAKKEQMALTQNLEEASSSDDEIELRNVKSSLNEVEATINLDNIEVKPKRKLNLSDAERERRRQSMIKTREIRQNKINERKQLEEEYIKKQEEEAQLKVIKKAEKLKKQKEKELYNQILNEQLTKSKKATKQKVVKVLK